MKINFFNTVGCKPFWLVMLLAVCMTPAFAATILVKQDGSGDFTTVQAALDTAKSGDTVIVSAGTYTEDIGIGHFNVPSLQKDNITLQAGDVEAVEIIASNTSQRLAGLAAAGFDPGPADRMGFVINGDNIVVDGIRFVQNLPEPNNLNINLAVTIGGANVTIRNCEIVGPGPEANGDLVGLVVATMDVYSISTGKPHLANQVTIENCRFTNSPYAFANADFLKTGAPSTVTITNCEFFGNSNAIEIDDGFTTLIDCHIHDNIGSGLHLSDDVTTVRSCLIENNAGYGFDIDNQALDNNEPPEHPIVHIEDCKILNNGTSGRPGLNIELGTVTITGSIVSKSTNGNVYLETRSGRETKVTIDHCDLYKSNGGIGVSTTTNPADIITFSMTNSIVVDYDGVFNNAGVLGDFTVEYCDIFASGIQFEGEFNSTANIIKADPQYVDAENGNFYLKPGSPAATAGRNGTFMGSKGIAVAVSDWMIQ